MKVFPRILTGNLLNRSPFLSQKKRSFVCAENKGEMSYEGSPVKALPLTTRRMMPPTPKQSSHSSNDELHWQTEMEVQGSSWTARERTVIARMEKCLNVKLEIEELELLMSPKDSEVNLRYILTHASRAAEFSNSCSAAHSRAES